MKLTARPEPCTVRVCQTNLRPGGACRKIRSLVGSSCESYCHQWVLSQRMLSFLSFITCIHVDDLLLRWAND